MGYNSAWEMAHAVDLDTALGWHLTSNHYPPIPSAMIPIAKEAIEGATEGAWDREINLRDIYTFQGTTSAPVSALVDYMHLEVFLDPEDPDHPEPEGEEHPTPEEPEEWLDNR